MALYDQQIAIAVLLHNHMLHMQARAQTLPSSKNGIVLYVSDIVSDTNKNKNKIKSHSYPDVQ